jgi:hypothetical protein
VAETSKGLGAHSRTGGAGKTHTKGQWEQWVFQSQAKVLKYPVVETCLSQRTVKLPTAAVVTCLLNAD